MSVLFYMDVHIPLAITEGLRLRGVDVLTSQEDGTREMEDAALLDRSTELGRVLFTMDRDFLYESSWRRENDKPFAGIIYAQQQKVTVGQCINDLELIAKVEDETKWVNRVEYLPL